MTVWGKAWEKAGGKAGGGAVHAAPRRLALILAGAASLALSPQAFAQGSPCTGAVQGERLALATLKARYGRADDRWFTVAGHRVRYRDEGEGQAIVLLHGSHASLDAFDGLAERLSSRFRVIRFDMPGMGLSDAFDEPVADEPAYADDILRLLLDDVGIRTATIVGTSSGGAVGYFFAGRFPERVDALVLANVPADPVDNDAVPRPPRLAAAREVVRRNGFTDCAYWADYLRWLVYDPVRLPDTQIVRTYDMNRREGGSGHLFWRWSKDQEGIARALASVRAPTMLVWGLHDDVLPEPAMEALARRLTGTPITRVPMPDVGHYPPFEVPDRFAVLLEAWLYSVADPG